MTVKKLPTTMIEVDLETGEETVHAITMDLLPPPADCCQVCGASHDERAPHNQQSLYYQTAFHADHGRSPTWEDAMEHCSEEVKKITISVLEENGVDWRRKKEAS